MKETRPASLGQGRMLKRPEIFGVRELTQEEVETAPRAKTPGPKVLRDHHHRIARLFAMGMRNGEIAQLTGFSPTRLHIIRQSPAMDQLVEDYRKDVHGEWREEVKGYYEEADRLRTNSLRQIGQQLDSADETGEALPISTLLRIHDSLADRTGYPKRKENVNLNIDFADRLEKARLRSAKVIELHPSQPKLVAPELELRPEKASSPAVEAPAAPGVDAGRAPEPRFLRRV